MQNAPQIIESFKDHLATQFDGIQRKTKSITTGNKHSFYQTHLNEVPRLTKIIIDDVRQFAPQLFSGIDPDIIDIIARGHDLFEDGYGKDCPEKCQKKPTCPNHYTKLVLETRALFIKLGMSISDAEYCVSGIAHLSKDFGLPKNIRNLDMYRRLSHQPLEIKLIKLGDNWHNLSTLYGRGFDKAVTNYLKIRKSWETIFSNEELEALSNARYMERPIYRQERTALFTFMEDAMQRESDLPDLYLPCGENPQQMVNPLRLYEKEIGEMEKRLIHVGLHKGIRRKIENICLNGMVPVAYPILPNAGESQVALARMTDVERFSTLCKFQAYNLSQIQNMIANVMEEDAAICIGQRNMFYSDMGHRERVLIFLDTIERSGEDIMRMADEDELNRLIEDAIIKERERLDSLPPDQMKAMYC